MWNWQASSCHNRSSTPAAVQTDRRDLERENDRLRGENERLVRQLLDSQQRQADLDKRKSEQFEVAFMAQSDDTNTDEPGSTRLVKVGSNTIRCTFSTAGRQRRYSLLLKQAFESHRTN